MIHPKQITVEVSSQNQMMVLQVANECFEDGVLASENPLEVYEDPNDLMVIARLMERIECLGHFDDSTIEYPRRLKVTSELETTTLVNMLEVMSELYSVNVDEAIEDVANYDEDAHISALRNQSDVKVLIARVNKARSDIQSRAARDKAI